MSVTSMMKDLLAEPMTRGMDIDDPKTTALRQQIVKRKGFLNRIYHEWYELIVTSLPSDDGPVLELGSGCGFLGEVISGLITSDIMHCPHVRVVLDGMQLPFADASLRGIVMTDVLHHLSDQRRFFTEAARCVRPGGVIAMIEPWATPWSRIIHALLQEEPFEPRSTEWGFPPKGPLSGANGALPWILFHRDIEQFRREFPQWRVEVVRPFMPFRYIMSGGVTARSFMPKVTFGAWKRLESLLDPWRNQLAIFCHVALRRV
ncbi:MAG: methyltransferase domain-containing protein [Tepidisphaeraceae bacterium]